MAANEDVSCGEAVVAALGQPVSKFVKQEREAFVKAQRGLEVAQEEVERLGARERVAARAVDAADQAQDAAVTELAHRLAGEGFSRFNPFKTFGSVSPSLLMGLGVVNEARKAKALAKKVLASDEAKAQSKQAAEALYSAGTSVLRAEAAHHAAVLARHKAVEHRDGVNAQWQVALTDLRSAVRYADMKEGSADYDRVFGVFAQPSGKKAVSKPPEPVS